MHAMSPQDASFLHIEDEVTHMHIGTVGLFEGPAPSQQETRAAIEVKLPLVPRYRQKVRFVPLDLGRPVWVDDPHFVLDYHVRSTALPAPGGDEQLRILVGRVMSQRLDRSRPLWELWVAEGLGDGRWAMISKVHHCMVDGVSATDLLSVLLDREREPATTAPSPWRGGAPPPPAGAGAPAGGCGAGAHPGGARRPRGGGPHGEAVRGRAHHAGGAPPARPDGGGRRADG